MEPLKDRPPYVTFEQLAEEDREASMANGHYTEKDVDYAVVTPAGSKDRVYRKVDEWFVNLAQMVEEDRFDPAWLEAFKQRYKAWKSNIELPESGTPLVKWPGLSKAQVTNLQNMNVRTVEDLANLSEEGIARIGMGGRSLKQRAADWLAASSGPTKVAEELSATKQRLEDLTTTMEKLVADNAELKKQVEASQAKGAPTKV